MFGIAWWVVACVVVVVFLGVLLWCCCVRFVWGIRLNGLPVWRGLPVFDRCVGYVGYLVCCGSGFVW